MTDSFERALVVWCLASAIVAGVGAVGVYFFYGVATVAPNAATVVYYVLSIVGIAFTCVAGGALLVVANRGGFDDE